jgi:NADPH:quinone reductase-like Zn-dependent oxidoreductase
MKAIVINHYGPPEVLEHSTLDRPAITDQELLVKVHATSVNPVECSLRQGKLRPFIRVKFPFVLGVDVFGEVEEVGAAVTKFKPGDKVYAFLRESRGGAYAEYAAVPEAWAGIAPRNLTPTEAGVTPGVGMTAFQTLHSLANVQSGQSVLINGASGGVGTFAIQIARAMGAEVTAVCSAPKVELVKRLGAQRVIDYTQEDFTQDSARHDVIFDTVGNHAYLRLRKLLKPGGIHITTTPRSQQFMQTPLAAFTPGKRSKIFLVEPGKDIDLLTQWIEAGKVKPVVDRVYSLDQMVEAHRYSEQHHAAGKIAVTVSP